MARDRRDKATAADEAGALAKPEVKNASASPSGDFWRKPLEELSKAEWEALCDGCGRCCLVKLEDEDNGKIYHTDIACKLFDPATCQCKDYPNRRKTVPDCVSLSKANVRKIAWLPPTCAYRLRAEGRDLEWWHYLVSGSRQTVHTAGISCKGRVGAFEDDLPFEDYPQRIVRWPGNFPKGKRRKPE